MRRGTHCKPGEARGFTLLELLVAVVVLAVASVAALRSFDAAQRGVGGQVARLIASEVAQNRVALMRLNGGATAALPATVRMGGRDWTIDTRQQTTASGLIAVEVIVQGVDGPGARLHAIIPAGQQ